MKKISKISPEGKAQRETNSKHNTLSDISKAIIGYDIGSNKTAKDYLASVYSYFENIISNMPCYVYWKDKNFIYLGCNDLTASLLKLPSRKAIIGMTDYDFGWKKEDVDTFRKVDAEIIATGKPQLNVEETISGEQGFIRLLVNKMPIFNENREIIGIVGISIDITELKKTQFALKQAKEEAETANQSKSEFIANMNHDMRTPLSGIIGMAESIVHRTQELEIKENAKDIFKSGQRLLEFANNILNAVQLDAKDFSEEQKLVNVKKIMRELKELFMPAIIQKKLAFNMKYDNAIPRNLVGDSELIHRIGLNLLSNAIKFTEVGKITLQFTFLKQEGEKSFIKLSVSDTGIGIAEENLSAIFEQFKKLSSSYQGIYSGNGLGLYFVKQMVKKLGGKIEVQSELGKGTVFNVTLPFLRRKNSLLTCSQLIDDKKNKNNENKLLNSSLVLPSSAYFQVLVVEDDEIAGKVLSSYLRENNCNVHVVSLGKSAIHNFKSTPYDLVYMDIGLPDIDGREVTQILRAWEKKEGKKPTPIIAVTAHLDESKKKTCLAAGLNLALSKPISRRKVKLHIHRYINKNHQLNLLKPEEKINNNIPQKKEISRQFLLMLGEKFKKELPTINKYYDLKNWDSLRIIIHQFKGSTSYCNIPALMSALTELEKSLISRSRQVTEINACFKIFLSELNHFLTLYA